MESCFHPVWAGATRAPARGADGPLQLRLRLGSALAALGCRCVQGAMSMEWVRSALTKDQRPARKGRSHRTTGTMFAERRPRFNRGRDGPPCGRS